MGKQLRLDETENTCSEFEFLQAIRRIIRKDNVQIRRDKNSLKIR